MVSPLGQPWGRGVGKRSSRLHGHRPVLGQGQLPRPLGGLRRAPGQRRTLGSDDVAGCAGRAPRRQRLAGAVLTHPRFPEAGAPPAWLHGPQVPPSGPGGQRGQPCRGDRCRLRRGTGRQAEGPPPADEEEPEPEQGEAGTPETPGTVIPSAPSVQERRDIVERGSGSHGLFSSRWGSPDGPPGIGPSCPLEVHLGADRRTRPLFLSQARRGQRGARLSQASPGVLGTPYQPKEYLSSVLTIHAVAERWTEAL